MMYLGKETKDLNHKYKHTTKAAEREWKKMLFDLTASSTKSLFNKLKLPKGGYGIDLGCVVGEKTCLIKNLARNGVNLVGLDQNHFQIEIAKESTDLSIDPSVEFRFHQLDQWKEIQTYDFVYTSILSDQLSRSKNILKQVYESLKPGGTILFEDIDMGRIQSFPISYVFDRLGALNNELKEIRGNAYNNINQLQEKIRQTGFQNIKVQMVKPCFIKGYHKRIASLFLEHKSAEFIQEKLTTHSEIQALQYELKEIEQRNDTMIILPPIVQFNAQRIA